MANVLNRTTKQYIASANTPDYPTGSWIVNPDLSTVQGFASKYWTITGDVVTLMSQADRDLVDDQEFQDEIPGASLADEIFGDGVDGDIVLSSNATMNRDYYVNTLTVQPGVTLETAGFRIIARRGVINHGTIQNNGSDASLATGGSGAPSGSLGGGGTGATGLIAAGVAATDLNAASAPGYGGAGGNGGTAASGTIAGGAGGSVAGGTLRVRPRRLESILLGIDIDNSVGGLVARFQGGAGGGSGGGAGAVAGAGGGGGGGIVVVVGPYLFNGPSGLVAAKGGNGFTQASGNVGGGGGGGGGIIAVISRQTRNRGSISVAGGAGGSGSGNGGNGTNGSSGRVITLTVGS